MLHRRFRDSHFYRKHCHRLSRANDLLSFFSALCLILFLTGDQSHLTLQRHALSNEIRITAVITGLQSGIFDIDEKVIRAMARVPRHHYVSRPYTGLAYYNVALPVKGQDHMIPEPFITAMMLHLMEIDRDDAVLDIGFGTSYDAAVMAQLARTVHAVNQVDPLDAAGKEPSRHRYANIFTRDSNGSLGWPEAGPFDAILVRQSMQEPPLALLRQLKPGGRLVIPIGAPGDVQRLTVYTREADGIGKRATLHMKISPLLVGREI